MRTTVSDILLFQKCPYAWYVRAVNKRVPTKKHPAMEYGTKVHKEFEKLLRGEEFKGFEAPELAALPKEYLNVVHSIQLKWEVLAVEQPITIDIGGHTIDGTPDAVLRNISDGHIALWQLKTSSACKAHHIDIVRYSLHECMYGIGVGTYDAPILRTLLGRYIRTKAGKRFFYLDEVVRTIGDVEAARQYIVRICDQMEEMTLGKRTEGWQSPPSCVEWTTGIKCDYYNHCHLGTPLGGYQFEAAPDRYAKGEPPEAE